MRAAICRRHGGPEVVAVEEIDVPPVGAEQVGVRVHTAAVNFPDVLVIANDYQIKVDPPFVPGSEYAGEVVEVGADVTSVQVGDRVFGSALVGAFADQISAAAASVTKTPDGVDHDVAAGFGVAHRTAFHVLRSVARLQPEEELIVTGAGGGVGLAAVQLGALLGASVTAVASSELKLQAARQCGASRTINYRDRPLRAALRELLPGGGDVVVDPVGGELSEPALRALRRGGRFVTVGYASGEIPRIPLNLVLLKGIAVLGFEFLGFAMSQPEEIARNEAELMGMLAAGTVAPHVEARFSLEQTAAALQHLADGKAIGKVLIDVVPR
jgi:NADPH2:quinone reductase